MNPYENVPQTPELVAWMAQKPERPLTSSFKDFCEWESAFTKWSDEYDRLRINALKPSLAVSTTLTLIPGPKGFVKIRKQKGV